MLSQIPIDLSKVKQGDIEKEALRLAIIAELDAITLYEEKTHVGEFQALLLKYDKDQVKELENGRKEVEELSE
jgi:rubrerythrin